MERAGGYKYTHTHTRRRIHADPIADVAKTYQTGVDLLRQTRMSEHEY